MLAFIGIFPKDFGVTFFNMRNGMKRTNQIFFHYDFAIMFDNSNTLFLTLTIIKTYCFTIVIVICLVLSAIYPFIRIHSSYRAI